MLIREGSAADADAIRQLIAEYPEELVQDHVPDAASFFIAEEGGRMVGCCALDIYSPKMAEVRSLAVSREFRGKGIARALVEKCVERAQERGVYQIIAITSNLPFFDKFGFHTFHQEKYAVFRYLR